MQVIISCPSVAGINPEQIKNEIITCLEQEQNLTGGALSPLSPLERYAIASQIGKAATEAARELSDAGIEYALDAANGCQPMAGEGKMFTHNGHNYMIQFINDYNYNQGDAHGIEWYKIVSELEALETRKKGLTRQKKGLEAIILTEHPRLHPCKSSVVLKFMTPPSPLGKGEKGLTVDNAQCTMI